ncbi:MAG TPA: CBS domain-containing protein [Bryobacteraceae bacterium]|nr:CBS domain-containing protein [Bryobacteraceae bacterium]
MPIGDVCVRDVVIAGPEMTVREAARLMAQYHVGNLVVVREDPSGVAVPTGIITDRDIVRNVVAEALDPSVYTLGDLGARELITVWEDEGVFECMREMRINGVRRMPVVDRRGGLVGIISLDDLVQLLAQEMGELAKLIIREQAREEQLTR